MKRPFGYPAVPCNLSEAVQQRLGAYAMAASAAGVGLLALPQPVEAQIVYTQAHVILKAGSTYLLDLANDGRPELEFVNFASQFFANLSVEAWGTGGSQNKVEIAGGGRFGTIYARPVERGAKIAGSQSFYGCGSGTCSGDAPRLAFANKGGDFGLWINVQNRYLGIQFPMNGKTHYGWARLSVHVEGIAITALLNGYAYEATPNKPIIAGKTSGQAEDASFSQAANPETLSRQQDGHKTILRGKDPASLGMLALGAAGLGQVR